MSDVADDGAGTNGAAAREMLTHGLRCWMHSSSGGAGINVLPGAACCTLCKMPASVATMDDCLALVRAR